jgi:uncharacterized protein YjiS (DUF1127 family)
MRHVAQTLVAMPSDIGLQQHAQLHNAAATTPYPAMENVMLATPLNHSDFLHSSTKPAHEYVGSAAAGRSPADQHPREVFFAFIRALGAFVERMQVWQERTTQRTRLSQLDDRLLHDIGISRADAYREARKPFWRA